MTNLDHFKKRIYEIVEVGAKGDIASKAYDIMILTAVLVGLLPLTIKTSNQIAVIIDVLTLILFLFDYAIRIFTSDYKMGVKSYKAYVYYAFTPMAIVDLLSISPVLTFLVPGHTVLNLFRIFRVLQLLKLVRYSKTLVIISNVMRKVKKQITAVILLTVVYIVATALIIFQVEPDLFDNFLDAIYWSAVSITTIGYGDISPVSNWAE